MPYNFAADSFPFLRRRLGDLAATYDDHIKLIGKRVVDLLLVLTELLLLDVTAEELRRISVDNRRSLQ